MNVDAALLRLHDRLRALADPDAILRESCRQLAVELGAGRVHYVQLLREGHAYAIEHEHAAPGMPVQVGRGDTAPFGDEFFATLATGRTVVVEDVRTDPLTAEAADAYVAVRTLSAISAPLARDGRLIATLSVDHAEPRRWTGAEVRLVAEVADRTWAVMERARAEAALRAGEAKYRALFESIDEGFCLVEILLDDRGAPRDYRFVEANQAFAAHTGLRDAVGRTARELVPDLEDHWVRTYGDVALTGRRVRFQQHAAGMAGRWFDVYAFRVGEPSDRLVGILFVDVTERRRAERERDASEARFRMLADSAPAMVWMTEPDGTCSFMSRGWSDVTGQTETEALGAGWLDAVHPDDRAATRAIFEDATARRVAFQLDYRLRGRDGLYRWAVDVGRPRSGPDGAFAGFVGSVIDVHPRRLAEDALRDADRRKDEFLAMLAHELRNPLAPVMTALEIVRRERELSPAARQATALASRQLVHMRRMLDDLLDASRVSRGAIELRREPVSLGPLLEDVAASYRPAALARAQTLSLHLPPRDVVLHADPARLSQIAGNLVNNALKFSPEGATVALRLDDRVSGGEVEIRVEDEGPGLSPDRLEEIFELFTQVEPLPGAPPGGLGIGLAMVRRLAGLHGGRAWARSDGPGRGSTFVVRLPLEPPAAR